MVNIRFCLIATVLIVAQSCNLSKHFNNKGILLKRNIVTIKETNISRFYQSDLESYIKQTPNKKMLGLVKAKLWFYNLGMSYPDTKLKQFYRFKLGEPPVFIDTILIEQSVTSMQNYLKTEGFYYPNIAYKVKINTRETKGIVQYNIILNEAYHIYNLDLHVADKNIDSIIAANSNDSYLKLGNKVKLKNLFNEQNRITNLLKNNSYYTFKKEEIKYDIDTAVGNYNTNVALNINNPTDFNVHQPYKINEVKVEINATSDTLNFIRFNHFKFKSTNFNLNPKVIDNALVIQQNQMFNQQLVTRSYNRLSELQLFGSVSFNTTVTAKNDTPELNYHIKLTPLKRFDFSVEPQAITTDQANLVSGSTYRNYGIATVVQLLHRNVFNNGELLQWRFRTSFEAQRGPNIPSTPFLNSFENGLTVNLILPKFLFLQRFEKQINSVTNRTIISASAIHERNVDWRRYLLTTSLNYQVTKQLINYTFSPITISFVKTDFANTSLENQSKTDPYLQSIFTNNLIFDTRFGFVYNNQSVAKNRNSIYFRWDVVEIAGTFINALNNVLGNNISDTGYNKLFGVPIFQYYKTWADFRFNNYLDVNNKVVYRLAAGFALPYGNTPNYVPFDRRFFIGGANSIRAFLPRSIGPGSYVSANQLDRSGDVKIESNVEFRFNLFKKIFEGAIFADAGNIYRIKYDGRDGANFKLNTFYKDMAVGVGLGFRINLDFLVFRFDPAIPIRDPRKPDNEKWVPSSVKNFGELLGKTVINFGVGYPF